MRKQKVRNSKQARKEENSTFEKERNCRTLDFRRRRALPRKGLEIFEESDGKVKNLTAPALYL
jgi:hypothetical protein